MNIFYGKIETPIGWMLITADETSLFSVDFVEEEPAQICTDTTLIIRTKQQLNDYFSGFLTQFDLPCTLSGTDFQKQVWNGLIQIPYGRTWSYGDLARFIERPKACRAVGGANHNNQFSIIIPCHRVIGANGKMVGYGGGLWRKIWLLDFENKHLVK